ncbi:MAG: hypothetical protein EAZ06_04900 [Cytophagales bacterium]|nr:MAG: hypothetical protein EAZ06_04900 [Cytophagales bacterium]
MLLLIIGFILITAILVGLSVAANGYTVHNIHKNTMPSANHSNTSRNFHTANYEEIIDLDNDSIGESENENIANNENKNDNIEDNTPSKNISSSSDDVSNNLDTSNSTSYDSGDSTSYDSGSASADSSFSD